MSKTARCLAVLLAVLAGWVSTPAWAGSLAPATQRLVGVALLGQSESQSEAERRSQVQELLSGARDAIRQGDFAKADTQITQAEQMNVRFGLFHFGDTPQKARRTLEKLKSRRNTELPSRRFTPFDLSKKAPGAEAADPFLARTDSAPATPVPGGVASGSIPAGEGQAGDRIALPRLPDSPQAASPFGTPKIDSTRLPTLSDRPEPSSPTAPATPLTADRSRAGKPLAAKPDVFGAVPLPQRPPAKVRRDLRVAAGGQPQTGSPARNESSSGAAPSQSKPTSASHDPFVLASNAQQPTPNPQPAAGRDAAKARTSPVDRYSVPPEQSAVAAVASPHQTTPAQADSFGATPRSSQGSGDVEKRGKSNQALMLARRYLAVGDTRLAREHIDRAKSYAIAYGPQEDTPDRVEAALRKYEDVVKRRAEHRDSPGWRRQYADVLMEQADALLRLGDVQSAERLARDAQQLEVRYNPFERNPAMLLEQVERARHPSAPVAATGGSVYQSPTGVRRASGESEATGPQRSSPPTQPGPNFELLRPQAPQADARRMAVSSTSKRQERIAQTDYVVDAAAGSSQPVRLASATAAGESSEADGLQLYQQGEKALQDGDKQAALRHFRAAQQQQQRLNPAMRERLVNYVQALSSQSEENPRRVSQAEPSLIDAAAAERQLKARSLAADVAQKQSEARRLRESDPKKSLELLQQVRQEVSQAEVDAAVRAQLMRRLELSIGDAEKFIERHRGEIELDERNAEILDGIDQRREAKLHMQQKIAELVDKFNQLSEEQRYGEAEVVAKRARELAPDEPVVQQLWLNARNHRRLVELERIVAEKENGFFKALQSVDKSDIPFDDRHPYVIGDAKEWSKLSQRRSEWLRESRGRKTERELEIERKLKTPVSMKYTNAPLAQVMDDLSKLAGVPIHLDHRGLAEEGVSTDTPISVSFDGDISLKSALNLILEQVHLGYVIKDEVLKITSEQLRAGEVYRKTYYVADLVIPIPNFVPGPHMGLSGQLNEAYSQVASTRPGAVSPMALMAGQNGESAAGAVNPQILAQMMNPNRATPAGSPWFPGPAGTGGGAEPDFDQLIDLITTTIHPNTWDGVGGPGSVAEFETNLSLVVSQTQEVHEEIADLLEQLRRLQDLQVTIEVRFITLSDSFFEQIGVDFDFNIEDRSGFTAAQLNTTDFVKPSVNVGLDPQGAFTADLDIPFRQGSYALGVPQFGLPADISTFGFALLSDIEAFFLIRAGQGDRRSNVLQAPKVTLFNGQQAFVNDTSSRPFVISVIPVVADFAAAQQPVIVVLSEGTMMSIQAVVSPDRRYVRLTVIPFFSQIGEVNTFTFEGSTSTTKASSEGKDDDDDVTSKSEEEIEERRGVTVQLPTFISTSVTTTVSVPDGGTVLLGGIKRLSEGRNEFGVPLLSKIPYVNRLFKNVGIGRETQSLMMMVTPRIIIQEEEEERILQAETE